MISDIEIIEQALEDIYLLTNPDGSKQIDIATVHVKARDAIEYINKYMK